MTFIIGLGNPGKKYQKTRHNVGFRTIDQFTKENNFPEFKLSKKFNCLISQDNIDKKTILLAKPQTFMNESGKAVKKIISNTKYTASDVCVVHDDIDLALGKIKITQNRGSAGHKGVESIIKELKTKNFIRLRIGIKPKINSSPTEDLVLKSFTKQEEEIIKKEIKKNSQIIKSLIENGIEKTMSEFNQ